MRAMPSLNLLRLWLLVLALFLGQAAMLAHGLEHLDGGEPPHACRLCLAGQNVDGPVPPATAPALVLCQTQTPSPFSGFAEPASVPHVAHSARGPPFA